MGLGDHDEEEHRQLVGHLRRVVDEEPQALGEAIDRMGRVASEHDVHRVQAELEARHYVEVAAAAPQSDV